MRHLVAGVVAGVVLLAIVGLLLWKLVLPGAETPPVDIDGAVVSAPDFDLPSLSGTRYAKSDFAGRVLLLEFWATWCGPCRFQEEILEHLYDEVRGPEVEFVAVNLGETEEVVREFTRSHPFPYPVLIDAEEALGYALEIFALPTVAIVDRSGNLSYLRAGISDADSLRRALSDARGPPSLSAAEVSMAAPEARVATSISEK